MTLKLKRFSLALTEKEYQIFQDEATKRGISFAGFLRQSAHFQIEKKELKNDN